MPGDPKCSWCNNDRNKVHNSCNVLESSWNHNTTSSPWKKLSPMKLVPGAKASGNCCSTELHSTYKNILLYTIYSHNSSLCSKVPLSCLNWFPPIPVFSFWVKHTRSSFAPTPSTVLLARCLNWMLLNLVINFYFPLYLSVALNTVPVSSSLLKISWLGFENPILLFLCLPHWPFSFSLLVSPLFPSS